jgi:hypothetical protein
VKQSASLPEFFDLAKIAMQVRAKQYACAPLNRDNICTLLLQSQPHIFLAQ